MQGQGATFNSSPYCSFRAQALSHTKLSGNHNYWQVSVLPRTNILLEREELIWIIQILEEILKRYTEDTSIVTAPCVTQGRLTMLSEFDRLSNWKSDCDFNRLVTKYQFEVMDIEPLRVIWMVAVTLTHKSTERRDLAAVTYSRTPLPILNLYWLLYMCKRLDL